MAEIASQNVHTPLDIRMYDFAGGRAHHATIEEEAETAIAKITDQRQRVIETQQQFIEAFQRWSRNIKNVQDARRAYFSDAWEEDVKQNRRSQALPTSNDNIFAEKVDILVGTEANNRRDIRFIATEKDDERQTQYYNMILRHVSRRNRDYYYEPYRMFRDGIMVSRAHRYWEWTTENDFLGELRAHYVPADEVLLDPDATTYDFTIDTDARYRIWMQWVTPRELRSRFRDRKIDWSQLEVVPPRNLYHGRNADPNRTHIQGIDDNYLFPSQDYLHYFWHQDKWLRLIQIWRYDYRDVVRVLDLKANDVSRIFIGDFDTEAEADSMKVRLALQGHDVAGFIYKKEYVRRCSYHATCGNIELDWKSDIGRYWPWDDFFAVHMDGQIVGLWNRIEDPQKWVNFIGSKLIERVGRLGFVTTVWRDNSLVDDLDPTTALRDGGKIVIKEDVWDNTPSGRRPFEVIDDPSLTSIRPLVEWMQYLKESGKRSSNIGDIQKGQAPGSVTAASALAILQQESLKGLSVFSANMAMTRAISARLRLYLFLERYKRFPNMTKIKLERIFGAMFRDSDDPDLQKVMVMQALDGGVDLDQLLLNIQSSNYDVVESTDPNNLLVRTQKTQTLLMLAQSFGVQVPPEVAVDLAPGLESREREMLRRGIEQMREQQRQALGAEQAQMMEALQAQQRGGGKPPTLPGQNNTEKSLQNPMQGVVQ